MLILRARLIAILVAVILSTPLAARADSSLFQRLGGLKGIQTVVDDFIGNVADDPRINGMFKNANIPHLNEMLVELIASASGGPVRYTGRDMKSAHKGMNITNAQFDALVEDLIKSLKKYNVGEREQQELLGLLGPMRPEIVNNGNAAAASSTATAPVTAAAKDTLYARLGGKDAIVAVVDDFVARVVADNRINSFFTHANAPRLKDKLVELIVVTSGGPGKYTGLSMKKAHEGMRVTNRHFDILVEDLVDTLNKFKVPAAEQQELLKALGPMRPDIVEQDHRGSPSSPHP